MKKHALFFGSLRATSTKGYNFDRFGKNTQKHIKTFRLKGYDMYSLGAYPTITPSDGEITVELQEVDDKAMSYISRMEAGAGYKEIVIPVEHEGKTIEAIMYYWPNEQIVGRNLQKVESGDWE